MRRKIGTILSKLKSGKTGRGDGGSKLTNLRNLI